MRIFDQGSYEMLDREPGKLTFRLEGNRLRGIWHLIRTGVERGKEQWLAILSEDQRPDPAPLPPPDPMLATLGGDAFDDPAWSFEPKWDGIRAIAICTHETRLVSRNRHDVSVAYPELAGLHDRLVATNAVLDGEIIALENGIPSFQALQHRMHLRRPADVERASRSAPVTFMAFDLLYLDGEDLTGRPLDERQGLLDETVVASTSLQVSPVVIGTGQALYTAAEAQGLEGVMAKRIDSRYHPGRRSPDWVKIKTVLDADVVVLGWRPGSGNRSGTIGSLVLGVYDGDTASLCRQRRHRVRSRLALGRAGRGGSPRAGRTRCSIPQSGGPSPRYVRSVGWSPSWWRRSTTANSPRRGGSGLRRSRGCETTRIPGSADSRTWLPLVRRVRSSGHHRKAAAREAGAGHVV